MCVKARIVTVVGAMLLVGFVAAGVLINKALVSIDNQNACISEHVSSGVSRSDAGILCEDVL